MSRRRPGRARRARQPDGPPGAVRRRGSGRPTSSHPARRLRREPDREHALDRRTRPLRGHDGGARHLSARRVRDGPDHLWRVCPARAQRGSGAVRPAGDVGHPHPRRGRHQRHRQRRRISSSSSWIPPPAASSRAAAPPPPRASPSTSSWPASSDRLRSRRASPREASGPPRPATTRRAAVVNRRGGRGPACRGCGRRGGRRRTG